MFLRLFTRGLWQRRSRAALALLALTLAATIVTALLNLYVDARAKIESEFRLYGANVMVVPAAAGGPAGVPESLPSEAAQSLLARFHPQRLSSVVPVLYAVAELKGESVVVNGTWPGQFALQGGFEVVDGRAPEGAVDDACWLGRGVAQRFPLAVGDSIELRYRESSLSCRVAGVVETGQAEDSQILAPLDRVADLTAQPDSVNAILLRATGDADEIEATVAQLAAEIPSASVAPLRQITESEFRAVDRIRRAAAGTTLVVLVITTLCVLTTMVSLAFERQKTIGTLKALGATNARIASVFVAEGLALAGVASLAGFAAGQALAVWLGGTMFSAGVTLRWITFPWAAAATMGIALLGTVLPIRLARRTQPAVILRGE